MPSLIWNKSRWDGLYQWDQKGDEWSATWGGADMQWYGTILPRIHDYLTNTYTGNIGTSTILEIAPGFGRWTKYLKNMCQKLIIVDLSQECIEACQERFVDSTNIEFHVNDGKLLDMISDNSIDFVFSMDSLVHCEIEVLDSYLEQLSSKLKPDGVGFFHHSNLGQYIDSKGEPIGNKEDWDRLYSRPLNNRGRTVSAEIVKKVGEKYNLSFLSQELIDWAKSECPVDCISVFAKSDSSWHVHNSYEKLINTDFMAEARKLQEISRLYKKTKAQ
ncbi:MAG: class I SAM-dependent methyltransferase [Cyanobacteria bacterium P01_F01_bin.143]